MMSKKQIHNKAKEVAIPNDPNAMKKLKISLGIIIAAFAFLLYAQSIHFNYTLDDHPAIDENKYTTQGFSGIPMLLKTDYWHGYRENDNGPIYRPASLILFAIEWQFFPHNPHISHLVNVLLYSITCFLLFLLLCQIFQKQNLIFPFVCALLYTTHPIHTEVVNNIKSCDEILCFLFGILSLYLILKYVSNKSLLHLILGSISYFLSLISKETGIAFLLIIPLTIFVFADSNAKKTALLILFILSISILYFIIRMEVLKFVSMDAPDAYLFNSLISAPDFISRECTAFYVLLRYIILLIFPHPLTCDYNFSQIKIHMLSDPISIFALIINFGIGTYAILNIRKKSIIAFGILFYLITLVPVSNVFLLIGATMAERFMYTPSLGFCIVLTYFFIKLSKTEIIKSKFQNLKQFFTFNSSLFIILFIFVGLYSAKTFSRNMDWKDTATIYCHDVTISENSAPAHYIYAFTLINAYSEMKDKESKKKILEVAIHEINIAISIYPHYYDVYFKLAYCYSELEDYEDAAKNFEIAMKLTHNPTAKLYNQLAILYGKIGQYDKAISSVDSAIKIDPNSSEAYNNKGNYLMQLNRNEDAVIDFQKANELNPANAVSFKNLGSAYANLKQYSKALECYKKSSELDSTIYENYYFSGLIYLMTGDSAKAKPYLTKANRMREGQPK